MARSYNELMVRCSTRGRREARRDIQGEVLIYYLVKSKKFEHQHSTQIIPSIRMLNVFLSHCYLCRSFKRTPTTFSLIHLSPEFFSQRRKVCYGLSIVESPLSGFKEAAYLWWSTLGHSFRGAGNPRTAVSDRNATYR